MEIVWVRPQQLEDVKDMFEWASNGSDNYFDPGVLDYPATKILVAHNSKPIVQVPIQTALMLDSLAVNPEATKHEISVGLREVVNIAKFQALGSGIGEIYFLGTNQQTNEFATKHGFEVLPWQIYRLRTQPPQRKLTDENIPPSNP